MRDGKRLVTDGPFAETREQLGGYYWAEANDLDGLSCIAERSTGTSGTIETWLGDGDSGPADRFSVAAAGN